MENPDSYVHVHQHRTPEQSRAIRKKILFVTLILSVITVVEVAIGIKYSKLEHAGTSGWEVVKWMYIILTMVKAGYIVLVFMHLGDERKNLKFTILLPPVLIIFFIFIMIFEGSEIIQYLIDIF